RASSNGPRIAMSPFGSWPVTSIRTPTASRSFGGAIWTPWPRCLRRGGGCAKRRGWRSWATWPSAAPSSRPRPPGTRPWAAGGWRRPSVGWKAKCARCWRRPSRSIAAEAAQYGPGRRGDELPAELARRERRLLKIRAAKAALQAEAQARAAEAAEAARAKRAAREQREGSAKGKPATIPDPEQAQPAPTAERNFTDPESRIMVAGATKEFVQGYKAQAAVDSQAQVI